MNRHVNLCADVATLVDRTTEYVNNAAKCFLTNRYSNRSACIFNIESATQTFRAAESNGADDAVAKLLLHFECNFGINNLEGIIDRRHAVARKLDVNNSSNNLYDSTATHVRFLYILSTKFYLN